MPAAVRIRNQETHILETHYGDGIPIGYKALDGSYIVYNHLHMEIKYNTQDKKKYIVSFEVEPRSILTNQKITWEHNEKATL